MRRSAVEGEKRKEPAEITKPWRLAHPGVPGQKREGAEFQHYATVNNNKQNIPDKLHAGAVRFMTIVNAFSSNLLEPMVLFTLLRPQPRFRHRSRQARRMEGQCP